MKRDKLISLAPYIIITAITILIFYEGNKENLFLNFNYNSFADIFTKKYNLNIVVILNSMVILFCLGYRSIIYIVESETNISAIIRYHSKTRIQLILRKFIYVLKILLKDFIFYIGIMCISVFISGKTFDITILYIFIELFVIFLLFMLMHLIAIIFLEKEGALIFYYIAGVISIMILLGLSWRLYA